MKRLHLLVTLAALASGVRNHHLHSGPEKSPVAIDLIFLVQHIL
jgi:hypothetical protein